MRNVLGFFPGDWDRKCKVLSYEQIWNWTIFLQQTVSALVLLTITLPGMPIYPGNLVYCLFFSQNWYQQLFCVDHFLKYLCRMALYICRIVAFGFFRKSYFFPFTVGGTIKNQVQFQLHYHCYPLDFFLIFFLLCLVDTSASFEIEVI